ncbi:PapG chaperone-binding domain-containing protein, partial [Escherichia coli]|uniref:PapG chaperone-binding domain-containing protein n=1 Tax=Escherichia coli TaxID=562 RepID=UPI0025AB6636
KTSIFSHPVYLFLRKFSLQDSRGGSPAYNNQGVAVGLGNGWDSIIYLDGVKRNEETLRWNTAGSRTVTVGSKLYGEAGKITSGALSGSMTMIMHLP